MEVVDGKTMRIRFDGKKCIHARQCVLGLPQVFKANVKGPWIDPDAASPQDLIAAASRCPSGAIVVERLDGQPGESPSGHNAVAVLENGPYAVRGAIHLNGQSAGPRLTLCRCGASTNKPYCDGSHTSASFAATGEFEPASAQGPWPPQGPIEVTPIKDGPLKVSGPHEVTCGTGRTIKRGSAAFLCRCGASNNKPFCDGAHKKAGFTADGQ